jgi:hypothetical protein
MKPKLTDAARFSYPYTSAADTAKPGYLKRRFEQIRRNQQAAKPQNVTPIIKVARR